GERRPHGIRRQVTVHRGEGEHGAHHRLCVRGQRRRLRGHVTCSLSRADWIDCAYASLVYVAPLTAWIRVLCAASTSDLSMGMTCWASCGEYWSMVCRTGTDTATIWPPRTVTVTDSCPYPYCPTDPATVRARPVAPLGRAVGVVTGAEPAAGADGVPTS